MDSEAFLQKPIMKKEAHHLVCFLCCITGNSGLKTRWFSYFAPPFIVSPKIKTRLRLRQLIFGLHYARKISKICLLFSVPLFPSIQYKKESTPSWCDPKKLDFYCVTGFNICYAFFMQPRGWVCIGQDSTILVFL